MPIFTSHAAVPSPPRRERLRPRSTPALRRSLPKSVVGRAGGVLGLTALAWLALGCRPGGSESGTAQAAESGQAQSFSGLDRTQAVKVLTSPVDSREMVRSISTTVSAQSEREIQMFPRTSGVAMQVHVEEGDRVDADEVLLELDERETAAALAEAEVALKEARDAKRNLELSVTEAEARVESAQLTYEQSKREYDRKQQAGEGVLSRNELEQLALTVETNQADLSAQMIAKQRADTALISQAIAIEKAQLQVDRAELNMSFTKMTAPFAGVIAERSVRVGDLVSSAAAAFVLSDTDNVRAVVSRPQRELAFFRAAERRARLGGASYGEEESLDIEILPEALPGAAYTGRILFVSPTIDPASGQFRVTLAIDQPDEADEDDDRSPVLPGMLLRIRIVTERHPNALVVPKRGLLREGESHFVILARDGKAERVRVEEGFASDDFVEVLPSEPGTLNSGDLAIVVGNRDLESGDAVEASPWKPTAGPLEATPEDAAEADASADVAEAAAPDQDASAAPTEEATTNPTASSDGL